MLELLWMEGLDKTTYKVLFPITTPLTPWPPQITDCECWIWSRMFFVLFCFFFTIIVFMWSDTQPQKKAFDVLLGYFLPDVKLLNITFGSELLTVSEVIIKGIVLQEQSFPNGTKAFTLQVPFSEPHVQVKVCRSLLVYGSVFPACICPVLTWFHL